LEPLVPVPVPVPVSKNKTGNAIFFENCYLIFLGKKKTSGKMVLTSWFEDQFCPELELESGLISIIRTDFFICFYQELDRNWTQGSHFFWTQNQNWNHSYLFNKKKKPPRTRGSS
jgi:hypothetical protein